MPLFQQLPAHIESRILGLLAPNEIACTVRGLSKECAEEWRSCVVVRLSRPVPPHAFTRQWAVGSPALQYLTLAKRRELLRLTASSGVLENLVLALDSAGCLLTGELGLMEAAAGAGHVHVCLWLRDRGLPWGTSLDAAAGAGRRSVCEQLLGLGCDPTVEAAVSAAEGGHVGLMDWLLALLPEGRLDGAPRVILAAASGCDLATVQRLLTASWLPAVLQGGLAGGAAVKRRDLLRDVVNQRFCVAAARSPTPDWRSKVEWLEGLVPNLPRPECSEVAALPDAVERLTWLRGRGYLLGALSVYRAVRASNCAALTYLLGEAGVRVADVRERTTTAARNGHLAALQLLVARGCSVDASDAICQAASHGHLAVVAWLVEELDVDVSELGPGTMYVTARSGSLELLHWLRERGCPWNDGIFAGAAEGGCEAALDWLVERGCPLGDGAYYYDKATQAGDLATVRCLRRLGVRWGPGDAISAEAVLKAPLAMLRWLVETAGVPVDWEAAQEAVETDTRLDEEEDGAVRDHRLRDREAVRDWLREGKRRQEGVQPGP